MASQPKLGRRAFLFSLFAAPVALLSAIAWAAKKTVTLTEKEASTNLVKEDAAMAKALRYRADAKKAKERSNPKAVCSNCMQYSEGLDAAGKPVVTAGGKVGTCALFDGGKGVVKADGWCMSWYQAPA